MHVVTLRIYNTFHTTTLLLYKVFVNNRFFLHSPEREAKNVRPEFMAQTRSEIQGWKMREEQVSCTFNVENVNTFIF